MAKKQTRRSISVSRTTYERLKAFCETNHISMSQLVETRVNDFLGGDVLSTTPNTVAVTPAASLPSVMSVARPPVPRPAPVAPMGKPVEARPQAHTTAVLSSQAPVLAASASAPAPFSAPLPTSSPNPSPASAPAPAPSPASSASAGAASQSPMTSAAVRFAVDPPPPIIKPRQDTGAPKPAEKRPDQIFTF